MLNMKPIPINSTIIATANTVSPNGKHTACINKTWIIPKITIADNDKVYFADKKPTHFQHSFFNTTKIHALQFNSDSNKLYCLANRKQQSKLYQFSLIETEDQSKNSKWQQQPTIPIALAATYFSIDEINQDLMVVFFKNNELFCNTIDIESGIIAHNHNIPLAKEKIIDIKFDTSNRIIYAYLENKSLIVFSETDNEWKAQYCLDNCPSLPYCYSSDGATLVFINNPKVQIRCLSSENQDKFVEEINYGEHKYKYKYTRINIKDVCINPQGDEITAFISIKRKYLPLLLSSKIKKYPLNWRIDTNNDFYLFADTSIARYRRKLTSYYVNSTNIKVLVEYDRIYFWFDKPHAKLEITSTEKLKEINQSIRESNRRRYEYRCKMEAAERQSSYSSNINSSFNSTTYSTRHALSSDNHESSCPSSHHDNHDC